MADVMPTVIAEPDPRAEIIEGLAHMCHAAKREMPVVGTALAPTPWDRRHQALNELLTNLELLDALG